MDSQSTLTNPQPQGNLQTGGNPLSDAILQKMLDSSGMISSTTSTIDQRISDAISGVKASAQSSNQALQSQYGREAGYTMEAANQAQLDGRAAGSGGVMNMAALRELTKTTDKNLNDLEQRKQELILQNNAQAASQISSMQIQALDFKQKAEQQTFANLLGMANFSIQSSQENRMKEAQSFNERSAMASMATQYGVTIGANDTLETVAARAAVTASTREKAELARITADVKRINAETSKAMNGDPINSYDATTIKSLARSAFALSKDPSKKAEYENILGTVTKGGQKSLDAFYSEMFTAQVEEDNAMMSKKSDVSSKQSASTRTDMGLPRVASSALGGAFNLLSGAGAFIQGKKQILKYNQKTGKMEYNK